MLQGTKANNSGEDLEMLVENIMSYYKFEPLNYEEFKYYKDKNIEDLFSLSGKFIIRKFPYTTLLGKAGTMDRVIYNYGYTIGLECRRQTSNGSVDEKLPHTYENVLGFHPTDESIIVVDGDGFAEGAIEWLKNSINSGHLRDKYKTNKPIYLMQPEDIIIWARKKFTKKGK